MKLGLGLGISYPHLYGGGGSAPVAAPITAVAADGFTATYDGTLPTTNLGDAIEEEFTVTRQGFSSAAAATTFAETIRVATPKRAAGTLLHDTGLVALSSYVMDDDTISGATNNSTLVSPVPVANCVTPDRLTVTTSIGGSDCPVEIFADHWSGIAAVKFIIAKGGTSIEVTVASSAISTAGSNLDGAVPWDRTPLPVYALPQTDISSLTGDGMVTVDYEVYPRVGVAASVLKSATVTSGGGTRREATTRYFDKRARGYVYAYVDASGVDASGVWYAAPTASPANPFLTVKGAMDAIDDAGQLAVTNGVADGCRIRLRNSATYAVANPAANLTQNCGALIVERDPATTNSASDVTVNFANAVWRPRLATGFTSPLNHGWLIMREVTLSRTGAVGSFAGETTGPVLLTVVLDNCRQDYGGFNSTFFAATGGITFHAHYGTQVLNFSALGMAGTTGNEAQIFRGVNVAPTGAASFAHFLTLTSKFTGPLGMFNQTDLTKGFIFYGNEVRTTSAASVINASAATGQTMGGVVLAQNIFESTGTTMNAMIGIGQDAGSTSHTLIYGNSATGWGQTGRWNIAYDRFVDGVAKQLHPFLLFQGNIVPQFNTKGDKFELTAPSGGQPASDYDGNIALDHGVLTEGNVKVFNSNSGGIAATAPLRSWQANENQTYMGRNSFRNDVGANTHYLQNASHRWVDVYTTYGGTNDNGSGTRVAGSAGTTVFTLTGASPAKSRLVVPLRTKDFAGATVTAPDSAGAYYA